MKKITHAVGQYAQLKLADGSRIFLEMLPEKVRVKKMIFSIIPTRTIWEFAFPFYIRTAAEAWESSKNILDIVLGLIQNIDDLNELKNLLDNEVSSALRDYVKEHGDEAREISTDKVGALALKQMLNPKSLSKTQAIVHEYGKIMEKTGQEILEKYPAAVFPESLLPYPKETIKNAIESFMLHTEDENTKIALKAGLAWLVGFINDKEANERNNQFLNNPKLSEVLRKKQGEK